MVQLVNEENVDQMLSVGEELGNHMVELVAQFDVRSWSALMYMPGDSDGRNHQLQ